MQKKHITVDARANREIGKFPKAVRVKLRAYLDILTETGQLREPIAKNCYLSQQFMKSE